MIHFYYHLYHINLTINHVIINFLIKINYLIYLDQLLLILYLLYIYQNHIQLFLNLLYLFILGNKNVMVNSI